MNILICGSGKGSWIMRGQQLGAALGARVVNTPSETDLTWADLVVLVKKYGAMLAPQVQRSGKPIVWDALDFWRQPVENICHELAARVLLHEQLDKIKPALTIGATETMAKACGGVYLPHHSWAGLTPTPAKEHVQTVGYEGHAAALGHWGPAIQKECIRRGWTFLINQPETRHADILVAFRDGPCDGWICREWKSGVKAVNAIAAGRPLLTQDSAAVRELRPDCWIVEAPKDLAASFDYWASWEFRTMVVERAQQQAPRFMLPAIAEQYRQILAGVMACAA